MTSVQRGALADAPARRAHFVPCQPDGSATTPKPRTQAIPCELSVAAVKKLVWRRSDDVVFLYRVLDPSAPAPLPKLEPE